jgi:hypothetical protein
MVNKTFIKRAALFVSGVTFAWGASWAVNKYLFTTRKEQEITSSQIELLQKDVSKISNVNLIILKKLNTLDVISREQHTQAEAINSLNTVTRHLLVQTIRSRDTLIRLYEQLPPFILYKAHNNYNPIAMENPFNPMK